MTLQRGVMPRATPAPGAGPEPRAEAARPQGKLLHFPSPSEDKAAPPSRRFLLFEFVLLFVALPLVVFSGFVTSIPPLYILWGAAAYGLVMLWRDPSFDLGQLWKAAPLRRQLPQMLALFGAGVVVIAVLVREYDPHLFLILVRSHPRSWALIMLLYPFVSVYPQAIIYRAYLFHRYRRLLHKPWMMIVVSAAAFALVHIIFHNWIAVALTFPGGILFARRYMETRSLCVSSVEHALYGCFLFTVGLGQFFGVQVIGR
jgi:uncharacterized protein